MIVTRALVVSIVELWIASSLVAASFYPWCQSRHMSLAGGQMSDNRYAVYGWPSIMMIRTQCDTCSIRPGSSVRSTSDTRVIFGGAAIDMCVLAIGLLGCWNLFRWSLSSELKLCRFTLTRLIVVVSGLCVFLGVIGCGWIDVNSYLPGKSHPIWLKVGLWAALVPYFSLLVAGCSLISPRTN